MWMAVLSDVLEGCQFRVAGNKCLRIFWQSRLLNAGSFFNIADAEHLKQKERLIRRSFFLNEILQSKAWSFVVKSIGTTDPKLLLICPSHWKTHFKNTINKRTGNPVINTSSTIFHKSVRALPRQSIGISPCLLPPKHGRRGIVDTKFDTDTNNADKWRYLIEGVGEKQTGTLKLLINGHVNMPPLSHSSFTLSLPSLFSLIGDLTFMAVRVKTTKSNTLLIHWLCYIISFFSRPIFPGSD